MRRFSPLFQGFPPTSAALGVNLRRFPPVFGTQLWEGLLDAPCQAGTSPEGPGSGDGRISEKSLRGTVTTGLG
jgi:hypothetical protein